MTEIIMMDKFKGKVKDEFKYKYKKFGGKILLRKIKNFSVSVGKHFRESHCSTRSEALAFSTILSIVPLLTIFFSILTFFKTFNSFSQLAENFIFSHFLPDAGNTIQLYLHKFVYNALHLSIFTLIFLWIVGIKMIFSIEEAFNALWAIKVKRPLVSAIIFYGATLLLLPIALGISAAVVSFIFTFPIFSYAIHFKWIKEIILDVFQVCLIVGIFFLLYKVMPYTKVKINCALKGALFSTLLFISLKNIFVWYIENFTSYNLLYAALSVIPVFFIWIYCVWFIILLGGAVTYVLQHHS